MKRANIDREFLHIFWTTWGNSMKFSGKMRFKIILKVTKNQGSTLSMEEDPLPPSLSDRLGLMINKSFIYLHLSAKYNFMKACRRILFSGFCKKLLNPFLPGKVFPLKGIHLILPTFSVNYIISIIIICSNNHWSRKMSSKYCFKNFVPIIFQCVDCPIIFFFVS